MEMMGDSTNVFPGVGVGEQPGGQLKGGHRGCCC